MTRHALRQHAPDGAIFAVSSYGRGVDGQPAARRAPPARAWKGRSAGSPSSSRPATATRWSGSGTWPPTTCPGSRGASPPTSGAIPRSNRSYEFRARLKALVGSGSGGGPRKLALAGRGGRCVAALAGYDFWGFQRRLGLRAGPENPRRAVARRWSRLLARHPSLAALLARRWPGRPGCKQAEWTVKAAERPGRQRHRRTRPPRPAGRDQGPGAPARPGHPQGRAGPGAGPPRRALEGGAGRGPLARGHRRAREAAGRARRVPPRVPRDARAAPRSWPWPTRSKTEVAARAVGRSSGKLVDDLIRSESLPERRRSRDLIDRARQFLADHPESTVAGRGPAAGSTTTSASSTSATSSGPASTRGNTRPTSPPGSSGSRTTSRRHQAGGRFISEAIEARDRILREWDTYAYRQAYDHCVAHPDDVAEVARRLRDYLRDHPDGRYRRATPRHYLDWWDKVSVPGDYRVTLRRGEVEPDGRQVPLRRRPRPRRRHRGRPASIYGPSPVVRDTHRPIWDYTFPRPDPLEAGRPGHHPDHRLRLVRHRGLHPQQPPGRPPGHAASSPAPSSRAKGGATTLVFASDFAMPTLSKPE